MNNLISIIVGSESDLEYVRSCSKVLKDFSVEHSIKVLSAHRTPSLLGEHIKSSEEEGVQVFIAMAGLAAHLAGSVASKTTRPVIGVPVDGGPLKGFDALLSTVQMPKGIPVGTVAIGSSGAVNAAYLGLQILGLNSEDIANQLNSLREEQLKSAEEINKKIET
ncbi:MAG: 5-(carboxyamino)imidazole ribonucleotide mutase [Pseudomonadota bacterium]|nr:5-(carboxyamino)imidazole ribonucleotide mutase [Pseudomonadota bacterium]